MFKMLLAAEKAVVVPGGKPWDGGGGQEEEDRSALQPTSRVTLETGGEAGVSLRVSCPVVSYAFSTLCCSQSEPCSIEGSKVVERRELIQNRAA